MIRAALSSPLSPLRGAAPNGFASKLCSKQSLSNLRFSSHPRSPNIKGAHGAPFIFGWRRRRDSNPRYAINVYSLSRGAPSATRPLLRKLVSETCIIKRSPLQRLPRAVPDREDLFSRRCDANTPYQAAGRVSDSITWRQAPTWPLPVDPSRSSDTRPLRCPASSQHPGAGPAKAGEPPKFTALASSRARPCFSIP